LRVHPLSLPDALPISIREALRIPNSGRWCPQQEEKCRGYSCTAHGANAIGFDLPLRTLGDVPLPLRGAAMPFRLGGLNATARRADRKSTRLNSSHVKI